MKKNCKKCKNEFETSKGLINFCSLECRNSKVHSDETKKKIKEGVSKAYNPDLHRNFGSSNPNWKGGVCKKDVINICTVCSTEFVTAYYGKRKTCSRECSIKASTCRTYQNGSRKTIIYNGIVLESTWELEIAKLLDSKSIKWNRPEPIQWIDSKCKKHLYYPDFYLSDGNVYLDPKNPYCMKKDLEKMTIISQQINIIYGDIKYIIQFIENEV